MADELTSSDIAENIRQSWEDLGIGAIWQRKHDIVQATVDGVAEFWTLAVETISFEDDPDGIATADEVVTRTVRQGVRKGLDALGRVTNQDRRYLALWAVTPLLEGVEVKDALYRDHLGTLMGADVEAVIYVSPIGELALIPVPDNTPMQRPTLKELIERKRASQNS